MPPYVPNNEVMERLLKEKKEAEAEQIKIEEGSTEQRDENGQTENAYTNEESTNPSAQASTVTAANLAPMKPKKIGSVNSNKSSPNVKRTNPSKILGDFHLTKLNQVFEDF